MGRLEDSLRETLTDKVAGLSPGDRVADQVIHNARRARLRRAVGVPAAAGLAAALVTIGAITVAGGWGDPRARESSAGETTPAPSTAPTDVYQPLDLPVDVLTGDGLILAAHEGGTLSLRQLPGDVEAAWRIERGYLVLMREAPDRESLWLVPELAAPVRMVRGSGLLVTTGTADLPGVRIAWVDETGLHLGTLRPELLDGHADAAVTDVVSTPAPIVDGHVALYPRAIVGGAVILAGTQTGGGLDTWDYWFPDRGDFTRHDHGRSLALQGRSSDGETMISHLWLDGRSCLAELDPDGFIPTRTVCPSPFLDLDRIFPSPNGQWLLINGGDPQLFGSALYRADDVWSGADLTQAAAATGATASGVAWLDEGTTLAMVNNEQVTILYTDGRVWTRVPLPAGVVSPRLIPVL